MAEAFVSQSAPTVLLATFSVRDALYALDAAAVQEVIRLPPITSVHHAAEDVLGVINLRGRIVSVVDAGLKLGFSRTERGPECRVFIIEDRNEFIGLLVDRVSEVVEVERDHLEPPPRNVSAGRSRFFKGVHRAGSRVVTLIDVDQLLGETAQATPELLAGASAERRDEKIL